MRFLCAKQKTKADIYGQRYDLMPLDPRIQNIEDILAADNDSASELLSRHKDFLLNVSFDRNQCRGFPRVVNSIHEVGKKGRLLIVRTGGIGDHVLFLPALRILRQVFPPEIEIWLSTQKEKHPLFYDNKNIDRLLPLPLRLDILLEADYLVDFSERNDISDFKQINMTDYFLHFLDIDLTKHNDKTPRINLLNGRSHSLHGLFRGFRKHFQERPLVLLNWTASNHLRDLPPEKLLFLVEDFKDVVFVIAQPRHHEKKTRQLLEGYQDRVIDCSMQMASLEDYLAAVSSCDAVVSTDTASYHLAEALGKPSLSLFGPVSSDLRIRYYKKARAIDSSYAGETCNAPCGLDKTINGCPEALFKGTSYSPCLLSISKNHIRRAFTEMMKGIS